MIKEYKRLIKLLDTHMEQAHLKYAKAKCYHQENKS